MRRNFVEDAESDEAIDAMLSNSNYEEEAAFIKVFSFLLIQSIHSYSTAFSRMHINLPGEAAGIQQATSCGRIFR